MLSIVHPLHEELLGLIESGPFDDGEPERDTSWRWMGIAVALIGLLAWATR